MDYIKKFEKIHGVDIGYNNSILRPLNDVGCIGKNGIDKNYTLEQIIVLAYEIKANIIVKAGKNAKWYLKKCDRDIIDAEIQKQNWRDTSRATMWIIEWE